MLIVAESQRFQVDIMPQPLRIRLSLGLSHNINCRLRC